MLFRAPQDQKRTLFSLTARKRWSIFSRNFFSKRPCSCSIWLRAEEIWLVRWSMASCSLVRQKESATPQIAAARDGSSLSHS